MEAETNPRIVGTQIDVEEIAVWTEMKEIEKGLGRVEEMKEKMMIVEEIEEVDQVTKMKILHVVKEKAELVLALAVQVVLLVVVLVVQVLVAVLQALIRLDQDQEAKKTYVKRLKKKNQSRESQKLN